MTTRVTFSREGVTWEGLIKREPRLAQLLKDAQGVSSRGNPHFCANDVWYRRLKPQLLQLVGWVAHTDDPVLRSCPAYNLAYDTIYEALPACRECGCM